MRHRFSCCQNSGESMVSRCSSDGSGDGDGLLEQSLSLEAPTYADIGRHCVFRPSTLCSAPMMLTAAQQAMTRPRAILLDVFVERSDLKKSRRLDATAARPDSAPLLSPASAPLQFRRNCLHMKRIRPST